MGSIAHSCGGSIYNRWTIITAAHCFKYDPKTLEFIELETFKYTAGQYSLAKNDGTEQVRRLANVTVHEKFDRGTMVGLRPFTGFSDIAVVIVDEPFILNEHAQAIPMADWHDLEKSSMAKIIGWGLIYGCYNVKPGGALLPDAECSKQAGNVFIKDMMTCGGSIGGTIAPGDSGGPTVVMINECPKLVGPNSFIRNFCMGDAKGPSFINNAIFFKDWIEKHSKGEAAGHC